MWNLQPSDLAVLKGEGNRFAIFVQRLIRAEAARGGLPQSEIETQLRSHIADGGVDTRVRAAIPNDGSGWFAVPTVWQFKAVEASSIGSSKLRKELAGAFVRSLIETGYGYRFCLLDDVTPKKTQAWEELLGDEIAKFAPAAPKPRVVHGAHLLSWAERFPALIAWLRDRTSDGLHWDSWSSNCRAVTPSYVPNPAWQPIREQIVRHVDFHDASNPKDPCLTVGGAAGVGKTRLVFETLADLPGSPGLVVYAADEQAAKQLATAIANTPDQSAILVADECTPATQYFLNEHLRGHLRRLRVICLDNTGQRLISSAQQPWLSADELRNTDKILEVNFPWVPEDRRFQYAQLSRGYVRLAADMCQHDAELAAGNMGGLLGSVERYVRHRLSRETLRLVSLLALFHKVGFRDDKRDEVASLCQVAGCSVQSLCDAVRVVRESPGFVVQAGRYWYVSPEIVARVLFAEGWNTWVARDPAAFLRSLPEDLLAQLIDRAAKLGEQGVRDQLADFFRKWFDRLKAEDLADPRNASLAAAVVEAKPESYLPRLRAIIESAQADSVRQIGGRTMPAGSCPRRTLVWLLEKLVCFPEFFADCEACLFRLAVHETEPQIGNSATGIWRELFSVHLSGTAMPFMQRLEILRGRTASADVAEATLGFRGLDCALHGVGGKAVGPPIVAGRLRSDHWRPDSYDEELGCYRAALSVCEEHLLRDDADRRRLAFDVLSDGVTALLHRRLLEDLAAVLTPDRLTEEEARRLLNEVDRFLQIRDAPRRVVREKEQCYLDRVRCWIDGFRPARFDALLRSICSREPWDERFSRDPAMQRDEMDDLAEQIVREPSRLRSHLDWLTMPEAQSAQRLGFALGRADQELACGTMLFDAAIRTGSAALLRGYIRALVAFQRSLSADLLERLEQLEATRPNVAVDILSQGGDLIDGFQRVIRLVEKHAVPIPYLAYFSMGVGDRKLTVDEVGRVLPLFIEAVEAADGDAARAGLRFFATLLYAERGTTTESLLADQAILSCAWTLAETSLPFVAAPTHADWMEIVERLAVYDTERAVGLWARALAGDDRWLATEAEEQLTKFAKEHPEAVLREFGNLLLDHELGWRLQVHVSRDLVARLPEELILAWVRDHGLAAARAIARHLPQPCMDESHEPVVPHLTETVLGEFDDDQVLARFLEGSRTECWTGYASERFRRQAEDARRFLSNPNPRIRQWAKQEMAHREQMAVLEDASQRGRQIFGAARVDSDQPESDRSEDHQNAEHRQALHQVHQVEQKEDFEQVLGGWTQKEHEEGDFGAGEQRAVGEPASGQQRQPSRRCERAPDAGNRDDHVAERNAGQSTYNSSSVAISQPWPSGSIHRTIAMANDSRNMLSSRCRRLN
jgi:hypothetical protein